MAEENTTPETEEENTNTTGSQITIDPVIVSNEVIEDFRKNFNNPGQAFAQDLVRTFQNDYAEQIRNDPAFLTYEGLKNGTATFLNSLPSKAGLSPAERGMTDDDIAILFSNAEPASFARPFFGEMAKSAPATYAGFRAMGFVGPRVIPQAAAYGTTLAGPFGGLVGGVAGTGITGLAGLGTMGITYLLGDAIEENLLGPDLVITPNQRRIYEVYRTFGGGVGGALAPYMMKQGINLAGRQVLRNLVEDAPESLAVRYIQGLDKIIGNTGRTARLAPTTTALGEIAGAGGAAVGTYAAEGIDPGGTGLRLGLELIGGNTLANTMLRLMPKVVSGQAGQAGGEGVQGLIDNAATDKQRKLFEKINELYNQYGTPEQYDVLVENLRSPDMTSALAEAFPGVNFTAAQRGGDPLLMGVEATKAGAEPVLDAARAKAQRESYGFMTDFIEGLISTGDEANIRAAAELRKGVFDDVLRVGLQRRLNRLLEANERLRAQPGQGVEGEGPLTQEELSRRVYGIVGDYIDASRNKERALWQEVGDVPVIGPLNPDTPDDQLPNFLRAVDENMFMNPAFQRQFQRENRAVWEFIQDSRQQLGLKPLAEFSEQEVANVGRYERAVDAAVGRLDGFAAGQDQFGTILREGNALPLAERAAFFRQRSVDLKEALKDIARGSPRETQRRVSVALDKMADLVGVQNANAQRAAGRAAESTVEPTPLTALQLAEARSQILQQARGLAANPETQNEARILSQIARGIMLDLEGAEGSFGSAYDTARAYTRSRHDVLTRTLMGKADGINRAGAPLLQPEVFFQQFVVGNPSVTSVRLRQLQGFSEFADAQGLNAHLEDGVAPLSAPVFTTVNNLTDSFLRGVKRIVAKEQFNPRSGQTEVVINDDALQAWKRENQELLNSFPQLALDLENATTAQRAFEVMEATRDSARQIERRQTYLSELIGGRSPTQVIGDAIEGPNPERSLRNIFALRRAGDRARGRNLEDVRSRGVAESELTSDEINQGFRTAILEYAYQRAGREAAFNPQEFYKVLFEGMPDAPRTSLMETAMDAGIFDDATRNRLKFMTEQLMRVQAADNAGRLNDPTFEATAGPIMEFYIGVLGAAAGNRAYRMVSPAGGSDPGILRASSAGAQALRSFLIDLPAAAKLKALDMVFTDPQLVAMLMRRPDAGSSTQQRQYRDVLGLLQEKLFNVGSAQTPYVVRETFEEEDRGTDAPYPGFPGLPENPAAIQQQNIERLRQRDAEALQQLQQQQQSVTPPPTSSNTVPAPSPVNPAASQQGASIQGSGPVDRTRYAALFPEDRDLVGIMSLSGAS